MTLILGLDPGPEKSALVAYYATSVPVEGWFELNSGIKWLVAQYPGCKPVLAVEEVVNYGRIVGKAVFQTALWSGRFIERWIAEGGDEARLVMVPQPEVKLHLCGTARTNDAGVRRAILDLPRWERSGGGVEPVIGTRKKPGPLYGISGHMWSALAVAIYAADKAEGGMR